MYGFTPICTQLNLRQTDTLQLLLLLLLVRCVYESTSIIIIIIVVVNCRVLLRVDMLSSFHC